VRSAPRLLLAGLTAALIAGCSGGRGSSARPSMDDQSAASLIALADSAVAAADANTARKALDRALALDPGDPKVHLARGRFFTAIRRYKDAKAEFDRAAVLDPRSPEPAYQLGRAYQVAGARDSARIAYSRALILDPGHAAARDSLSGLLRDRYEAAGVPGDYPALAGKPTVSRGELAVVLAVELGADPDKISWRSDEIERTNWPELDQAWGARWLRATLMRRWIPSLPDGSYHLDDLVTRGQLALLISRVAAQTGRIGTMGADTTFSDLPARSYLARPAARSYRLGLPLHEGGRFDPAAAATGDEVFRTVRGLARWLGATSAVRIEGG
jgi:tetratricopeptide (TPR) repeat protein